MKTLEQFKLENGIKEINMMKTAKGREFANIAIKDSDGKIVKEITVVVATKFDDSKPAYVVEVTEDKNHNALENVFAICNSTVTKGRTFQFCFCSYCNTDI